MTQMIHLCERCHRSHTEPYYFRRSDQYLCENCISAGDCEDEPRYEEEEVS
jgi:hypothetical protein